MTLPVLPALRYVVPLREGGSLPAVLEVEGGDLYVAKFRGAGQGARALAAELIAGLLAQQAGLPVPALALLELDASFGRTERDPEIQDILKGSRGLNVGLAFLEGAFNFDPVAAAELLPPALAADVVWFDAFVTNIDRTPRNPNLLLWNRTPWLIDHGAALYFHHDWSSVDAERARQPFAMIRDHVLLPLAGDLHEADARMRERLGPDVVRDVLAAVPDEILMDRVAGREPPFANAEANRDAYASYLTTRLEASSVFVEEAARARDALLNAPRQQASYRR